jgi:ADP-heptose:LPS heptosyltransferase
MRIVEVIKSFTNNELKFESGHKYVMAEDVEGQYRSITGECMGMSFPIENVYRPYQGQDLTGKKLMCWRTGGIGDMMFLSPVLVYLKNKFPTCFLRVASGCKQPLENLPAIDELYDMPFDASLLEGMDYHLQFQGIIESSSEQAKNTHAADMFYHYFGIDSIQFPNEDKRPRLYFTKSEQDWLTKTLPTLDIKEDDYAIGIQMETSAPLRNFPKDKLKTIIDILSQEPKVKIVLIGNDQMDIMAQFYKGGHANVIAATKFTVRQSIVLANRYDLIISPDTFMIQCAGALEKPLIGLYGPFPSDVRMRYFKNAIGLDPSVVCSPCFKHDFRACVKGHPSPCFTQVGVEDVLQAANYQKVKFTGSHFNFMNQIIRHPNLAEVDKYLLAADKGICFFGGYYKHPNAINVDPNQFVKAEVSDLSSDFKREAFPFVLFIGPIGFMPKYRSVYDNSKGMVRPGGYYVVYAEGVSEQLFADVTKDLGINFVLMHSSYDQGAKTFTIAAKKPY